MKGLFRAFGVSLESGKFNKAGTHIARTTSITVEQVGDNWLDQCQIDELQATTITQYGQHLMIFCTTTNADRVEITCVKCSSKEAVDK